MTLIMQLRFGDPIKIYKPGLSIPRYFKLLKSEMRSNITRSNFVRYVNFPFEFCGTIILS